ncbi:MAG: DUF2911 domain-containing protein [Candidatus Micrarchaeaceae archaeon]
MKLKFMVAVVASLAMGALLVAQSGRPLSPEGTASAQVLGNWVKPERQAYTMGGEKYEGGKWIDITYGRPLMRGREAFGGTGKDYGKSTIAQIPGAPEASVWRAGANLSTRLKTEVPLVIGGKTVPAGEYSLFIDLKTPKEWTFIVSGLGAATKIDPNNKDAIYGAFGYTSDKDVARAPMTVDTLPYAVEELTWQFVDMTKDSGRIAIMWDKAMGSVPFKVSQ